MLVKIAFGLRKDQVQDIPPATAKLMLDDGRATLAFPDQFPVSSAPVLVLAPRGDDGPVKTSKKGRHAHD